MHVLHNFLALGTRESKGGGGRGGGWLVKLWLTTGQVVLAGLKVTPILMFSKIASGCH